MARHTRRPEKPKPRRRPPGPWLHGPIPVVGLVGGIGAGKSTAAAALAERGAFVIDADTVGHALLDQRPAREQVVRRFGQEVLIPGEPPRIDRKALGLLVFDSPSARRDLEAILHPRMRRTFEKAIDRAVRKGEAKAVVLDAAVLFEAGWNALCDTVAFVDAPRAQRLARVAATRGWTAEALDARENAQLPLDEKRRRADHVLTNDSDPEKYLSQIDRLWNQTVKPDRQSRRGPNPHGRGRPLRTTES